MSSRHTWATSSSSPERGRPVAAARSSNSCTCSAGRGPSGDMLGEHAERLAARHHDPQRRRRSQQVLDHVEEALE